MILYFPIMLALMCILISIALWKMTSTQSREFSHEIPPRPGPRPKAVPPFPFGTISDLIKDAERQAEEDFYATFPEERPPPEPPSGYAMDSSPKGIIVSNGVMTTNEWRERYQSRSNGEIIMLDEDTTYRSLQSRPKMIDVGTVDKPHRRYIEGIGIITADSEQKLERACEVALMEKFRESEAMMRYCDNQIRNSQGIPRSAICEDRIREKRRKAWENCKLYLDLLQRINL